VYLARDFGCLYDVPYAYSEAHFDSRTRAIESSAIGETSFSLKKDEQNVSLRLLLGNQLD
jgi:hypothetical protein